MVDMEGVWNMGFGIGELYQKILYFFINFIHLYKVASENFNITKLIERKCQVVSQSSKHNVLFPFF